MNRILLLALMVCLPVFAFAQSKQKKADKETEAWRYEIEPENVGTQGTAVVKVWSYSKSPQVAAEQAKKNAIHGVIFKGIPAKDRLKGRKPLVDDSAKESEHADFFKSFFANGGEFQRFVALTNNGAIEAGDVMKVDKKEYKVGVVVTVSYSELRSYLEDKGIVRKLNSGF